MFKQSIAPQAHAWRSKSCLLIRRVELGDVELVIHFDTDGMFKQFPPGTLEIGSETLSSEIVIRNLPISLKRCEMEAKLIIGKKLASNTHTQTRSRQFKKQFTSHLNGMMHY